MTYDSETFSPPDMNNPALKPVLHWFANLMAVYGLCARTRCRRARSCKGDARICVPRYSPLIPEDVREAAKIMFEGLQDELSFEQVREENPEVDDLILWVEHVHTSLKPRGAQDGGGKANGETTLP